ncbi:hypothetical protein GCM10028862_09190 [Luteimonas pelagia]
MNPCIRHLLWRGLVAIALVAIGVGSGLGLARTTPVAQDGARCAVAGTLQAAAATTPVDAVPPAT